MIRIVRRVNKGDANDDFGGPGFATAAAPQRAPRGETGGQTDPRGPRQERDVGVDATGNRSAERARSGAVDRRKCSEGPQVQVLCWGRAAARRYEPSRADFSRPVSAMVGCPRHRERRYPLARYEHAPRHVIEARYLGDYKVWLEFNDGRKGVVDLADELHGEELEPLRDRDRFARFHLDYGLASIAWDEGQDFPPEFLYERLKEMH